jgi:hypothetical protein
MIKEEIKMKNILLSLLLVSSLVSLSSCRDIDSYDHSSITYYVTLKVTDGDMLVPVGSKFTDPGVVATQGGKDVSSSVTKTGTVDASQLGIYTITYSAKNEQGYSSSATRTVCVYDPNNTTSDISGSYTLASGSYRLSGSTTTPYSGYSVTITKKGQGIYYISDWLGGYYDKYNGYGSSYASTGYFALNNDNTITLLKSSAITFSNGSFNVSALSNATYNPSAKEISFVATFGGRYYHEILDL